MGALEPYHDRVREAVTELLEDNERRVGHQRIAAALEGTEFAAARPELLLHHYQACGRLDLAAEYAERAARQAGEALAFGRAADMLALALSLCPREADEGRRLRVALAEAQGRAGRLLASADTFLAAAQGTGRQVSYQLKCRALGQLLRGGALERGRELADEVLEPIGVRIARGPRRATLDMLVQHMLLRLRGTGYVARRPEDVAAAELEELDVLWSVSSGFAFVDPMSSRALAARYARRALRTGDPQRIAVGLCQQASYRSIAGAKARDIANRYIAQALTVAQTSGSALPIGMAYAHDALSKFLRGDFVESLTACELAIELLRSETTDARWEIDVCEIYRAVTLLWLGRLRALDGVVSRLLTEAIQTGDQYLLVGLSAWRSNLLWLVRGNPAEARRYVGEAQEITRRHSSRFGMFDFFYAYALTNIELYEGRADAAWRRVEGMWPALRQSRLLSVQSVNTEAVYLRLRAALAFAAASPPKERQALLRDASRMASCLRGSNVRRALGELGKLMVACVAGESVDADTLARVLAQLDDCSLALHAAATRLRIGARVKDATAVAEANAYMSRERVVAADRLSWVIVPVPL